MSRPDDGSSAAVRSIGDYAVIGDCRSAALVSRDGSIDWLCWPRFDSPSIFGALLDEAAGRFRIKPRGACRSQRWYIERTNVLQTRFQTEAGSLLLTDLMPVASEEQKRDFLAPDHEILRIAGCEEGEVDLEMVFEPRPRYASCAPRFGNAGPHGVRVEIGSQLLLLRTDMPLTNAALESRVCASARLRAGEAFHFSLTFADDWPSVLCPLGAWSRQAVERSVAWWRGWASGFSYDGPERDAVLRSALVLKLLVYAPSGAIVAAPTTSLPERIGGDLNWDYRFCWLRDASLTVRALFGLGFAEEAAAFVGWLLHATRLTRPELRVLYDVYGRHPATERTLEHLAGYGGSRPVRVGNAATEQFQLDVYGEVVDAAAQFVRRGGVVDRETQRMLRAFGEYVCRNWRRPDEGLWEPRSGRRYNTHSRVLCWAALDRLLELHALGWLSGAPAETFAENRELIRREVTERAWNPALGSYVARLGGDELDASLLLLSWYGFEAASSERMKSTYTRIRERLGAGGDLLYRYRTTDSPGEGAFGICSFWGAEFLALGGGTAAEAQVAFGRLCGYANDVGLFAEEIDPVTGDPRGNFPQAFTHVGLINAALSLVQRLEERKSPALRAPAQSMATDAAGARP
jgi:GH15 family glucan-1,4-alpha-glucosidase